MILQLEIRKPVLVNALKAALKAQERIKNTTQEPEFIPIVEKVIGELHTAINSISEVKASK